MTRTNLEDNNASEVPDLPGHTIFFDDEQFDLCQEEVLEIFKQINFCTKDELNQVSLVNKEFAFMFTQQATSEQITDFLRFAEVVRKLSAI